MFATPTSVQNAAIDYKSGYNAADFRNLVLTERAYEFMSEAKRWFDLKRTNTVKEALLNSRGVAVKDLTLLWPISIQELNSNPQLSPGDQNPGY